MFDVRGVTPFFVGKEWGSEVPSGRFWFREIDPPFRRGWGLRFRWGVNSYCFGLCYRTRKRSSLEALDGYDMNKTPEEISEWDGLEDDDAASL
jgi:hypothetical protein